MLRGFVVVVCATVATADFHGFLGRSSASGVKKMSEDNSYYYDPKMSSAPGGKSDRWYYDPMADPGRPQVLSLLQMKSVAKVKESAKVELSKLMTARTTERKAAFVAESIRFAAYLQAGRYAPSFGQKESSNIATAVGKDIVRKLKMLCARKAESLARAKHSSGEALSFVQVESSKNAASLGKDIVRKLKMLTAKRERDLWLAQAKDTRKQHWHKGDEDEWHGMMSRMMDRKTQTVDAQGNVASPLSFSQVQSEQDHAEQDAAEDMGMYAKAKTVEALYGVNKYTDMRKHQGGNGAAGHTNNDNGFVDL